MSDEFLVDLAEITAGRPDGVVGGKAAGLGRLLAAGLRVPAGVVCGDGAAPTADDVAHLRAPLVVRSSANLEDGPGGTAAGLFESRRDVAHDGVPAAVAAVRASAHTPAARAYASVRGVDAIRMAVVIQEQVAGPAGVLYTRAPGAPASGAMMIEYGERTVALDRRDTDDDGEAAASLGLPPRLLAELRAAGLLAETAIEARDGADVEWVFDGTELWLVQARPIVHPRTRATAPPPAVLAGAPTGRWHWDITHNPLPLSPAQAALVRRVNALGTAPYPMAVIGGYLYCGEATAEAAMPGVDAARALYIWQRELMPALHWSLAPVRNEATPALAAALRAFDEVHQIYVGPLAALLRALRTQASRRHESIAAVPGGISGWLGRAARGEVDRAAALAALGDVSLEWDVAAPTFRERPRLLDAAIEARRGARQAPTAHALESVLHRIREEDDLYYFAAQAAVRRALLGVARARRLADPSDIFFVDLDQAQGLAVDALVARADRARAAQSAAATWSMPPTIDDRRAVMRPLRSSEAWRGSGSGGRAIGRAVILDPARPDRRPAPGEVALAHSITPAAVVLLTDAAAIVTEHGGLLGHAAAIARELDIPCVVGCEGITTHLRTGDQVLVDGEAGLVARVNRSPVR